MTAESKEAAVISLDNMGTTKTVRRIQENSEVAFSGMGLGMVASSIIVAVMTKTSDAPFIAILGYLVISSILGGFLGMVFGVGLSVGRQLRHEIGAFHPEAKNLSSWDTWRMMSLRRKKTVLSYGNDADNKKQVVITSGRKGTTLELISIPNDIALWDLSATAVTQAYGLTNLGKKDITNKSKG